MDLVKLSAIELSEVINRFQLPHKIDELTRLKQSGYNTLYFDNTNHQLLYYTLNNDKRTIQLSDGLINNLRDIRALGFGATKVVTAHLPQKTETKAIKQLTQDEIEAEIDRLSTQINVHGMQSLSVEELDFIKKNAKYF